MKNKGEVVDRVISLYQVTGWKKWFSRIRIWEAPCWEVEKLIPLKGVVVDLGCGEGILTNLWALSSKARKIIGIELDKVRVGEADRGIINAAFRMGNILTARYPKCDAIILFHVLHHLTSLKDQEILLEKCFRSLPKGGKLIIVEVDVKVNIKYYISWLTDHFVVPILFERKLYEKNIYYRNKRNWMNLLKRIRFSSRAFSVEEDKPFTNLVIECKK